MADVHDPKTRSFNMSRIRGKDTKPELIVRKYLHSRGLRYSLHNKNLPGKPDLCFRKYKTVIFVNGCFWHGHENCKKFQLPKTRTEWWKNKIMSTKERDQRKRKELDKEGWKVITVWECEIKPKARDQRLETLVQEIKAGK